MGDAKKDDLRVGFDSRLKLRFCGSKVTTDAGLLAYRDLDEVLGLTEMGTDLLTDSRQGSNKRHVVGGRAAQVDKEAASPSGVGRFETESRLIQENLPNVPHRRRIAARRSRNVGEIVESSTLRGHDTIIDNTQR